MNILEMINNLYTNRKCDWINELEESDIQPYIIQRWLIMNDDLRVQTRWLDKYIFNLSPKMYLSLAWSIIPKSHKTPFVTYIKANEESEEFDFILKPIRKQYEIADNDYIYIKPRLLKAIKANMVEWFRSYGVEKKYWKQYGLDFNLIKQFENEFKSQKGLESFGVV